MSRTAGISAMSLAIMLDRVGKAVTTLPLSALISQAVVAFTLELDNEF